jgi:hypothetical protein
MAIRSLTDEEQQKAAELVDRIGQDLQALYDLIAPNVSYTDFCRIAGNLRQKVYEVQKTLGDIRQIREYLNQLPGAQDLSSLNEALEKFRV